MSDQNTGPGQNPNGPIEKQPHAGNLPPDLGRERPIDGAPEGFLDQEDESALRTPESTADLNLTPKELAIIKALRTNGELPSETQTPPETPDTKTKEHGPRWVRRAIFGATAITAAIAAVVVGTRGGDDKKTAPSFPTSTTSAPQNASPSPSAGESVSPSTQPSTPEVTIDPAQAEATKIREMWSSAEAVAIFNGRPREERLAVVAAVYSQIMNGGYSNFFGRRDQVFPGGLHLFDFNPLDPVNGASEMNDGQQILDQMLFAEQAARAQYVGAENPGVSGQPGDKMDMTHALKMLSGRSYYTDQDAHPSLTAGTYDEMARYVTNENRTTEHLAAASRYTAQDSSDRIMTGQDLEGNTIQYKDVTYTTAGRTYTDRFVLEHVTVNVQDIYSETVAPVDMKIWLKYNSTRKRLQQ